MKEKAINKLCVCVLCRWYQASQIHQHNRATLKAMWQHQQQQQQRKCCCHHKILYKGREKERKKGERNNKLENMKR